MMTTIQQLGSALGTSIVASIVQGFQQTAAPDGFAAATHAGTGCGYLALVAVAVFTLAAYAVSTSERREASGDAARGDCAA